MINKKNLIVIGFLFISWVLLIPTYKTSSYKLKETDDTPIPPVNTVYLRYDRYSLYAEDKFLGTAVPPEGSRFAKPLKATLAFGIVAWISLTIGIVFMVINQFGILKGNRAFSKYFIRLFPFIGFILTVVSFLIMLSLPSALRKDCYNPANGYWMFLDIGNLEEYCNRLYTISKFQNTEGFSKVGPYSTFYLLVISSFFSLIGSILSIVIGKYYEVMAK